MLFNSYIFILFFLPICLIGYFTLNNFRKYTLAKGFLLLMSLWFYGYLNPGYLCIICGSILINFFFYQKLINIKTDAKKRKIWVSLAVLFNIALLVYFKYMDFFISNINAIFRTNLGLLNIALPLGISFFTFQQISFIIDSYRGEVAKYSFLDYASFVAFFPQLIAGPIVNHDEMLPQFMDENLKKFNVENFLRGIYIFVLGLSKKVLIADVFSGAVDFGFENYQALDSISAILVMFGYTVQIYFDFSGYCDMAIGIAKMFNIELPVNFDSPYKALTISEFWKRWHITLTRFLTKYVYIPLGGNRKGKRRTCINIMIVFLVSGFWHGASWTFVFWGAMHGLAMVFERICSGFIKKIHPALSYILTFTFVNVMWIFFRAETFTQALTIIEKVFFWGYSVINSSLIENFRTVEFAKLLGVIKLENYYPNIMIALFYTVSFIILLGTKNAYERYISFKPTIVKAFTTAFLFVWCLISLSGVNVFLYFNF